MNVLQCTMAMLFSASFVRSGDFASPIPKCLCVSMWMTLIPLFDASSIIRIWQLHLPMSSRPFSLFPLVRCLAPVQHLLSSVNLWIFVPTLQHVATCQVIRVQPFLKLWKRMPPWTPRLLQPLLIPRIQCCHLRSKHPLPIPVLLMTMEW